MELKSSLKAWKKMTVTELMPKVGRTIIHIQNYKGSHFGSIDRAIAP